jgi:hypothetical protein
MRGRVTLVIHALFRFFRHAQLLIRFVSITVRAWKRFPTPEIEPVQAL